MKKLHESLQRRREIGGNKPLRVTRRTFVKIGAMAAIAGLLPRPLFASNSNVPVAEKSLALYHTHTGEKLNAIYWAEGNYLNDSLREINYILRDPRDNEVHAIDPRLLDLLFAISEKIDAARPFHVISGYRSPKSNAFLRARSGGVAEKSLHLVGKAIDIRLPGRDTRSLQRAATALQRGGVGYYPKSDFIHVDVGRVRYW